MTEQAKAITFKGEPLTLVGSQIKVGAKAPHFKLVGKDLADIEYAKFQNKILVLSVAPSIDTPVCATQTRQFNKEAADLSDDVVIVSVSLDLPFALARFCGAEGIERVIAGPLHGLALCRAPKNNISSWPCSSNIFASSRKQQTRKDQRPECRTTLIWAKYIPKTAPIGKSAFTPVNRKLAPSGYFGFQTVTRRSTKQDYLHY